MQNVKKKISNHNRHLLEKKMKPAATNGCNCGKKDECPLNKQCLTTNIVYKAEITDVCGDTKEYIGVTAGTFNKRYANDMKSLYIQRYSTETELSKYAWALKEERKPSPTSGQLLSKVMHIKREGTDVNCAWRKNLTF